MSKTFDSSEILLLLQPLSTTSQSWTKTTGTHGCIIPVSLFVFACVILQLYRCPGSKTTLKDRHARRQPSTCVHHKDLPCLTTGCPARHVALVTKATFLAGSRPPPPPPLHLCKEQRGRSKVLSEMSGKQWLPFQRAVDVRAHGFLCSLGDSPAPGRDRQEERTRDDRGEMTKAKKNWGEKLLRCHARDWTHGSLRFQMSVLWKYDFKRFQSLCFPTLHPAAIIGMSWSL